MNKEFEYPDIPFDHILTLSAERWPEKTALVFQGQSTSFRELDSRASQLANALKELGLRKGDRVALFLPNCPEYVVSFFGVTRAGAAPTPLNPSYREREVRYQIEESGATALILHESLWPIVEPIRTLLTGLRSVILVGGSAREGVIAFDDLLAGQPQTGPIVELSSDDLAALPFSSGTTGRAKGVMLTHRNLVCNAQQFMEATRTTERDTLLVFLPLYHIYGVALMAFAVLAGAAVVLMDRFDMAEMVRLIEAESVTELFVVPPVMLALANTPGLATEQFRGLRFIMSAAAPLAPETARRVGRRFEVPVIQAYGMTEASPLTHMVSLDEIEVGIESVGVVAPDTHCRIMDLDDGLRQLPTGEVGEVVVSGPQIMAGYWNAPEESARALRDGWLYTGDVGWEDDRGNLYIVDRKKEMIKYKAFSIAPAELEALLLEHPAVRDCAVAGQPDTEAGEVPRAWVVLHPGEVVTPEELQAFVAERVAGYKQIRALDFVDEIARTPSGKILRRLLRES